MKARIIEIVELGQPQSLIQRENVPITELIKTDLLIEELNEQLRLYNVVRSLPLKDNPDYLQGLIDGYGGQEPIDELPNGFKDINEVLDKLYSLRQ